MKQPSIKINGKTHAVKTISWEHETKEMVYVTYLDKSEPLPQDQEKVAWKHENELNEMVVWPKYSRVLKGKAMLADQDYPRRLKEFAQQINPKPEESQANWDLKRGNPKG